MFVQRAYEVDNTSFLWIYSVPPHLTEKYNFLGISIVGQSNERGDGGIYIGSIMKGGAVAADGRIEPGDMLLQVCVCILSRRLMHTKWKQFTVEYLEFRHIVWVDVHVVTETSTFTEMNDVKGFCSCACVTDAVGCNVIAFFYSSYTHFRLIQSYRTVKYTSQENCLFGTPYWCLSAVELESLWGCEIFIFLFIGKNVVLGLLLNAILLYLSLYIFQAHWRIPSCPLYPLLWSNPPAFPLLRPRQLCLQHPALNIPTTSLHMSKPAQSLCLWTIWALPLKY